MAFSHVYGADLSVTSANGHHVDPHVPPQLGGRPSGYVEQAPHRVHFTRAMHMLRVPARQGAPPIIGNRAIEQGHGLIVGRMRICDHISPLRGVLGMQFTCRRRTITSEDINVENRRMMDLAIIPFSLNRRDRELRISVV